MQLFQISAQRKADWPKRVERATELAGKYTWASEILGFYRHILEFQRAVFDGIPSVSSAPTETPLRESLDLAAAARHFPALHSLVQRHGPAAIAKQATDISRLSDGGVEVMLRQYVSDETVSPAETFFALALLQPFAEHLALSRPLPVGDSGRGLCPACDSSPVAGTLRPEGDGGKRSLVCSLCLTEWEFRRILCPYCGETDHRKLPLFTVEESLPVVMHACDTCKRYLKEADLTKDGHAIAIVDEIATPQLDVWAVEHSYKKVWPNIFSV